jgi:carbonic anhydrase/acetyltransferase-like protein (isoleucine patch superfamily)
VTGDVVAAAGVNIWYGCVIRGDLARISLGAGVNLQDGCIVHTDLDAPQEIGPGVVAGHAAVLHGRSVGADTLVGIGARLLSGSVIGEECVIAAGSVVTEGKTIPPRSLAVGVPARVLRQVSPEEVERTRAIARRYAELARQYAAGLVERPFGPYS